MDFNLKRVACLQEHGYHCIFWDSKRGTYACRWCGAHPRVPSDSGELIEAPEVAPEGLRNRRWTMIGP